MVRIELWRASDEITMRAANFSIRELVSGKVSVEKSDLSVFGTGDEGKRVRAAPRVLGSTWKSGHLWPRRVEIVFYDGL
jgi:hypothetical protein